jgi:hypothetical protein
MVKTSSILFVFFSSIMAPLAKGIHLDVLQPHGIMRTAELSGSPVSALARPLPRLPQLHALRGGGSKAAEPSPAPRSSALPMLLRIGSMIAMYGLICFGEYQLSEKVLSKYLPALVSKSKMFGMVNASYGLVILINVVASSFMMMYLSFIPGGARKKYMELAMKKGDKDAEARFSLPKLYAEGFSLEAKEFNWLMN